MHRLQHGLHFVASNINSFVRSFIPATTPVRLIKCLHCTRQIIVSSVLINASGRHLAAVSGVQFRNPCHQELKVFSWRPWKSHYNLDKCSITGLIISSLLLYSRFLTSFLCVSIPLCPQQPVWVQQSHHHLPNHVAGELDKNKCHIIQCSDTAGRARSLLLPTVLLSPMAPSSLSGGICRKTSCAGGHHNMPPPLQVDLLTLKVVSESCVTWPTSVTILV